MGKTRRCLLDLLLAALCVGLGLLLPWAFRWVHNGEQVLLLLQLPVLLCGMLCGPAYGLSCGLLIVLLPQLFPGAAGVALSTGESCGSWPSTAFWRAFSPTCWRRRPRCSTC